MAAPLINSRVNWRLLLRLVPSLLVVLLLLMYGIVNHDPFFKKKISEYLSHRVSCVVRTRIDLDFEYFNPFTVTLHCSNINAHRNDWSCSIPRLTFQGSWAALLTEGDFGLECVIDKGSCTVQLEDGTCSLFNIVTDFLKIPSRKPFIVHTLVLKNGEYKVEHKAMGLLSAGCVSLTTKMQAKQIYIKHVIHAMQIKMKDTVLFTVTNGSGELLLKDRQAPQGSLYYTIESPLIPEINGVLYGVSSPEEKYLSLYSTDRLWDMSLSYAHDAGVTLRGHILLNELLKQLCPFLKLEAEIAFEVQSQEEIKGELLCNKIQCGTQNIAPIKAWFERNDDGLTGSFIVGENDIFVQGTVNADDKKVTIESNSCALLATPWITFSESEPLECSFSSDFENVNFKLNCLCKPYYAEDSSPVHLRINGNFQNLDLYAQCGDYSFFVRKNIHQVNFIGNYLRNKIIHGFYYVEDQKLKVFGSHETFKLIGQWINVPITGTGDWQLNAAIVGDQYLFDGALDQGQLRIGSWYNLLEKVNVNGVFNPTSSYLHVNELQTHFRTGSVTLKDATYNGVDKTACVPISFNNFLFTKQNEFFVQLNGYGCLQGSIDALKLVGFCVIDQSLITGNILSSDLYKDSNPSDQSTLNHRDILCDLIVMTKNEVPVKTPLFSTNAQCNLHVTGSFATPRLQGSIDFSNGSIYFPYDALFIKTGALTFNAITTEPAIELVAKNTIKNYDITLGLHGNIRNPQITLTSSPQLTKEQLIALLLGGAEDGSLSLIMPHTMTELFEQLLFGSTATISKTQKYIHSFFEPLKSVRLVPKFSDQTGRGGLRGALEIDVTDRLKASIQQNFSLTEDTRIDISYALSDEANIKATKDERGDVGCEIEMKWRW